MCHDNCHLWGQNLQDLGLLPFLATIFWVILSTMVLICNFRAASWPGKDRVTLSSSSFLAVVWNRGEQNRKCNTSCFVGGFGERTLFPKKWPKKWPRKLVGLLCLTKSSPDWWLCWMETSQNRGEKNHFFDIQNWCTTGWVSSVISQKAGQMGAYHAVDGLLVETSVPRSDCFGSSCRRCMSRRYQKVARPQCWWKTTKISWWYTNCNWTVGNVDSVDMEQYLKKTVFNISKFLKP